MEKKEFYKYNLPHFQKPGQAYFVTWSLKDAVPKKALIRYTQKLENLKSQIYNFGESGIVNSSTPDTKHNVDWNLHLTKNDPVLQKLKMEYYLIRKKYMKAYDDLLAGDSNPPINLSKPEHTKVIIETLMFWEDKKLQNYAFCIMPNHIHWVFRVFEKDEKGYPVYLQDILYSVKRFTANSINKLENRKGHLWQKESFDTTIRDEKHL